MAVMQPPSSAQGQLPWVPPSCRDCKHSFVRHIPRADGPVALWACRDCDCQKWEDE